MASDTEYPHPEKHPGVTVSIDAMGGDYAPHEIVKGAIIGARNHGVALALVGDPAKIKAELSQLDTHGVTYEIVPAMDSIEMDESPATAIRRKKDASIVVAAKLIAEGRADALVAAGSTGAAMASCLFNVGRIRGVDRPAIAVTLPAQGSPCLLLDGGANADCLPEMLMQFAKMGNIFMQQVYGLPKPRVGLLNIGGEVGKGNAFVNTCFSLLEQEPGINFIGNVEGRDMFLGNVDVAVCDGFTGNVALKSAEGVATLLTRLIKEELGRGMVDQLGALLAKSALKRAKKRVDHEEFGGALLLGIKGIAVIAHGGSSAHAINNAIRVAKEAVDKRVLEKISDLIAEGAEVSHAV